MHFALLGPKCLKTFYENGNEILDLNTCGKPTILAASLYFKKPLQDYNQ